MGLVREDSNYETELVAQLICSEDRKRPVLVAVAEKTVGDNK